ncbi:helix-turn-helix domain-containing protein [Streptomyces sp. NBC_00250]|uniref:helix-turn-helix domain-containing protein n=1 Tax=Streptomyces sp. NBC_00250 TaxID=2903641 RepID=UPI002E2A2BBB|nr:helix-turn-helix domain-containing protein [Streptomyces sp. NBC_00250]
MSRLDQRLLKGAERQRFAQELRTLYEDGATVGELAWSHRRSHALIHRLLTEVGVELPL